MSTPSDCCFSESHEWFKIEGDIVTIGITQFAANELTDITYVEMQPVGTSLAENESAGEVESVKTTSDIMTAFAGEITEINEAVADDPSLLNSDPFGDGWLAKIKVASPATCDALMDQATYDGKYPL
ncbi:MAG: glycine cleavage system protein GcvH [Phycisphaerales bacterium]|jgi:glycine cleavage system H protein|nr:glycine cleavage system protein GcvH [Phycisphaerales bacterium]|tara:strand:+ start:4225 stop:4605 length:381 start_codon:yes stop_codon:yes gene_type:complete